MERHRDEKIGLTQEGSADAGHQGRKRARKLRAVRVFKRQNQPPSLAVITQGGAGAAVNGRMLTTAGTKLLRPALAGISKRHTAMAAAGFGNEDRRSKTGSA